MSSTISPWRYITDHEFDRIRMIPLVEEGIADKQKLHSKLVEKMVYFVPNTRLHSCRIMISEKPIALDQHKRDSIRRAILYSREHPKKYPEMFLDQGVWRDYFAWDYFFGDDLTIRRLTKKQSKTIIDLSNTIKLIGEL